MYNTDETIEYYAARGPEYQGTVNYGLPKNAAMQAPIKAYYQINFLNQDVLEIACGPGYWTEAVALTARSILATDLDPGLVSAVRSKLVGMPHVRCEVADAYSLRTVTGPFTGAFAQYWWSHVPRSRLQSFLDTLHSKLTPGSLVMFLDDLPYGPQRSRRVTEEGDVLEDRVLLDGTVFRIVKNFPSESEIRNSLKDIAKEVLYKPFRAYGYWMLSYRTR